MAKVGIKDIALRAGVSIATVSHAFRNPSRVSEATRIKVLAAADEVGYTPNRLAANLRTARSGNIVAIIPDIGNSFNSDIIKAIEQVAYSRGYSVLLGDTQGLPARENEFVAMTRSRQADGIILMSHRVPFDEGDSVRQLPPIVGACEFSGHDGFPAVTVDDVAGACDATRHLLELGHRRIAVITGDMATTSSRERMQGYGKAMSEAGLGQDDRLIVHGDYSSRSGDVSTLKLIARGLRPSAIFCFSDDLALGCIYALRQQGLNVPADVSVVGYDDIVSARYYSPPLTTIAQPRREIGRLCATMLFDRIAGLPVPNRRHILAHRLVVRQSTAAPSSNQP